MKKLLLVLSVVTLCACGGGGGISSPATGDSSSAPKASALFDAGNIKSDIKAIGEAQASSFTAIDAVIQSLRLTAPAPSSGGGGGSTGSTTAQPAGQMKSIIAKSNGLEINSDVDCNEGNGSIDVSLEDNDSSTDISSGDIATLNAKACAIGSSVFMNGTVVATLERYSLLGNISGKLNFTNLVVKDSDYGEDYTLNGEVSISLSINPSDSMGTEITTYNNFSYKNNISGATGTISSGTTKLTYSTSSSTDVDDTLEVTDVFANIPELDGIVKIYTSPALSGKSNLDYYTSGILFYEGANESSIQIDAGSGTSLTQAKVTLTLNGSTITQSLNWDDL